MRSSAARDDGESVGSRLSQGADHGLDLKEFGEILARHRDALYPKR